MSMRWVTCTRSEADQHADALLFHVCCQNFAFDSGCNLLPFRLTPTACRGHDELFPGLLGDSKRKTLLQRCRRSKDIGWPGNEIFDHHLQALRFGLTMRAR